MKEKVFINLSNHPSEKWNDFQKESALKSHSCIVDIPFPEVNPHGTTQYIDDLVKEYLDRILTYGNPSGKDIAEGKGVCREVESGESWMWGAD